MTFFKWLIAKICEPTPHQTQKKKKKKKEIKTERKKRRRRGTPAHVTQCISCSDPRFNRSSHSGLIYFKNVDYLFSISNSGEENSTLVRHLFDWSNWELKFTKY